MCQFISWIEKDSDVIFLTSDDIFKTKQGKKLQKYCRCKDDLIGHGAIRRYYGIFKGGVDKECTDFSTPNNFPPEIVAALKAGKFRGLGTPLDCLLGSVQTKLVKAVYPAEIKYTEAYHLVAIQQTVESWEACQLAWDEYNRVGQLVFWDSFDDPKNRKKCWR